MGTYSGYVAVFVQMHAPAYYKCMFNSRQEEEQTTMVIPIYWYFALLFFWVAEDVVSNKLDVLTVRLGDSLTLNCTYNCSAQFIRGCWNTKEKNPRCYTGPKNTNGFCTVSLPLLNVTVTDSERTYRCYTIQTDDPQYHEEIQRTVAFKLQNDTRLLNSTAAVSDEPKESTEDEFASVNGESTRIKVLATGVFFVAMVLVAPAVYICVKRIRQICNYKGEHEGSSSSSPQPTDTVPLSMNGTPSVQNERVTLRIPTSDDNSDMDVPYAEILITVRGVSTPELSQVTYLPVGDHKQRWGDDSMCHLQASRSADRLHIPHPREVSRKMSTSSEYAVITYV
ncbi:uncharacterized protein LOC114474631 [Gouania willdenowi]|uniref:uncharacterized protein LOC114474631 n=1 Tax=Gouania willdenowi TaxID=441366 RepID=UPI0010549882|nr:uncharacterized protein LOC114474631 [Gouania willdenowi]